jgi:hypothetical protein
MKRASYWKVRIKFWHKHKWSYHAPLFPTKQAAEEYARTLFAVEKWETKELLLTPKEAAEIDAIDALFLADSENEGSNPLQ